jgi:photosystem II stability/assembly factor-like uncharacterized protein
MLRAGHPDVDGYAAPAFAQVVQRAQRSGLRQPARPVRRTAATVGIAAVLGLAAILAVVGGATILRVTQPTPSASDSGVANDPELRRELAGMIGVDPAAVLLTEDGAVATTWADDRLSLVLFTNANGGWVPTTIATVVSPRPTNGVVSGEDTITCSDLGLTRPTFVFGQIIALEPETRVSMPGFAAIGGTVSNGTYVFAVRDAEPGQRFAIFGEHTPTDHAPLPSVFAPLPDGAFAGGPFRSPTPCAPSAAATPAPTPNPTPATPQALSGDDWINLAGTALDGSLWATRGALLFVSTDGGATWRTTSVPVSSRARLVGMIFMADASHGWSITFGPGTNDDFGSLARYVVNRTIDGGSTWVAADVPGDFVGTTSALAFANDTVGYMVASASRLSDGTSTVLRTEDGGATWKAIAQRPWLGQLLAVSDATTVWAGGEEQAGGTFEQPLLAVSRDRGRTWANVQFPGITGTTEAECGCYLTQPPTFLDANIGFATIVSSFGTEGTFTRVAATNDGGQTWSIVADRPGLEANGLTVLDVRHWLMEMNPTQIDATEDGGATWTTVLPFGSLGLWSNGFPLWTDRLGDGRAAALIPLFGNADFPSARSALVTSGDGGATWTQLPFDDPGPPYEIQSGQRDQDPGSIIFGDLDGDAIAPFAGDPLSFTIDRTWSFGAYFGRPAGASSVRVDLLRDTGETWSPVWSTELPIDPAAAGILGTLPKFAAAGTYRLDVRTNGDLLATARLSMALPCEGVCTGG